MPVPAAPRSRPRPRHTRPPCISRRLSSRVPPARRRGPLLALAPLLIASCVSQSAFDERTTRLEAELAASNGRADALEAAVSELLELRADSAAAARVRNAFAGRLERMEADRARLQTLERGLDAHQRRIADLAAAIERLDQSPPMEAMRRLERDLADLDARAVVDARMTVSNRETLDATIRRLDRHEEEFERQMKLLGQYVQEQFVPLAEGLVKHLYTESERLQENAQGLDEFARRVDPYKFSHLRPGHTDGTPAPPRDDD